MRNILFGFKKLNNHIAKVLSAVMSALVLTVLFVSVFSVVGAAASDNNQSGVDYLSDSRKFIFTPGSEYSDTDMFSNFKEVLPGDHREQKILVKNDATNGVKIKVYMRSLGAHEDSKDLLSKMQLKVIQSGSAKAIDTQKVQANLFEAAADQKAQLSNWVCLGTLYSGGEVTLKAVLDVPVTLGNEYCKKVGYLDWQFKVEQFPVEDDDPKPKDKPNNHHHANNNANNHNGANNGQSGDSGNSNVRTGDDNNVVIFVGTATVSLMIIALVLFIMYGGKKRRKDNTKK